VTISETISAEDARCFYDRLGPLYDLGERFEQKAKTRGMALLNLSPGLQLLNVGVGTGELQAKIQEAVLPGGLAAAVDVSAVMLRLSQERVPAPGNGALCLADGRNLPFATASFDRLFSSYVLDLTPVTVIPVFLREMLRVLRPGGTAVLVGLTEGVTLASRVMMAGWKAFYRLSPTSLGGCRPLRLTYSLLQAGFVDVRREVVVQSGMPSEILVSRRTI
jgi:ubiquinone/menaquinone biosynthesis C-methylase UbiE